MQKFWWESSMWVADKTGWPLRIWDNAFSPLSVQPLASLPMEGGSGDGFSKSYSFPGSSPISCLLFWLLPWSLLNAQPQGSAFNNLLSDVWQPCLPHPWDSHSDYLFSSYVPTLGTWTHIDIKLPREVKVSFLNIPPTYSQSIDFPISEMLYRKSVQGQRDDLNDHLGPWYFLLSQ